MNTSNVFNVNILVRAVFGLVILSSIACQKGGSSNPAVSVAAGANSEGPGSAPAPGSAQQNEAMGTGDSTGGNGLAGKPYEAYIVDVTTTPEWKEWIQPIEDQFNSFAPKESPNMFRSIARAQKWFFVPVELGKIPKARIGVEFLQDPTQQLALQTRKEIWVNARAYQAADSRSRALLLMHEMTMFLFMARFEKISDLCGRLSANDCTGVKGNEEAVDVFPAFRPEARRPLVAADYENIRRVTSTFFERFREIKTDADLKEIYRTGQFDPRFWRSTEARTSLKIAPVTERDFGLWSRAQLHLGEGPRFLSRKLPRLEESFESIDLKLESTPTQERLLVQIGNESTALVFPARNHMDSRKSNVFFSEDYVSLDQPQSWMKTTLSGLGFDLQNPKVGDVFHQYEVFVGLKELFYAKSNEEVSLPMLEIKAILVQRFEIIEIRLNEGKPVHIVFGVRSPSTHPAWILSKEKWSGRVGVDLTGATTGEIDLSK